MFTRFFPHLIPIIVIIGFTSVFARNSEWDWTTPAEETNGAELCMQHLLKTNPGIEPRYGNSMLEEFCAAAQQWRRFSNDDREKTWRFTENQQKWLNRVSKCRRLDCICDGKSADRCAERIAAAGKSVRMEIRQMTDKDRRRFLKAVDALKADRIDNLSKYDILALSHTPEASPEAHFNAALLPYHREMLKVFEFAIRAIDPEVTLPFWDSRMDAALPNPTHSILWTDNFFGNGFGPVTRGQFGHWQTLRDPSDGWLSSDGRVVRHLGSTGRLMSADDVRIVLNKKRFADLLFCVDPFFEFAHGIGHLWVGGHLSHLRTSPYDPAFYPFHTFFDFMWEQWRQRHQSYEQRPKEYIDSEQCEPEHFTSLNSTLIPFSITVQEGLSNLYTDTLYSYVDVPKCPDCESPYLFCDRKENRCLSKVHVDGNCTGFGQYEPCYQSRCIQGRCVAVSDDDEN